MNPGRERSPVVKPYSSIGRLNSWCERMGIPYYSFVNAYAHAGAFKASQVDQNFLLATATLHDGPVVALGGEVSKILDRLGIGHFQLPHPSYRNRKLNDKAFEEQVLSWCRAYIDIKSQ